jgi:hypothetical protein
LAQGWKGRLRGRPSGCAHVSRRLRSEIWIATIISRGRTPVPLGHCAAGGRQTAQPVRWQRVRSRLPRWRPAFVRGEHWGHELRHQPLSPGVREHFFLFFSAAEPPLHCRVGAVAPHAVGVPVTPALRIRKRRTTRDRGLARAAIDCYFCPRPARPICACEACHCKRREPHAIFCSWS